MTGQTITGELYQTQLIRLKRELYIKINYLGNCYRKFLPYLTTSLEQVIQNYLDWFKGLVANY